MVDKATVGARIKQMRENRNLSVEQCCVKVGVSPSAWRMYESGNRLPRPEIMESIASLFGRTVQFIFFRE